MDFHNRALKLERVSMAGGISTKLVGRRGQNQVTFGRWPMLNLHPLKFEVMQYCLEKKDEKDWTYEKMRSKRWQLIKHWLSDWEEDVRMKKKWLNILWRGWDEEWRGDENEWEWKRRWHAFPVELGWRGGNEPEGEKEAFTSDLTFPGGSWGGGRVEQQWENEKEGLLLMFLWCFWEDELEN